MAKKIKAPLSRISFFSFILGFVIAFVNSPLSDIIKPVVSLFAKQPPWDELAPAIAAGLIYGFIIYFFVFFILGIFAKNVAGRLIKELRIKQLLPVNFKPRKSGNFTHYYEDIIRLLESFIRIFTEVKQDKDKFSKTLETYLDPSLKKELESRSINEMYLGSKRKKATIFFSDIRGFTAITENHGPEDIVKILNEYFTAATEIINKNKGRVNKYIGDAVMGVFEEPPKYSDAIDADKAVIAALDIQAKFSLLVNGWKDEIDPALEVGLGIGLAKGEVVAGNIGSEERMEYTVIGDAVNFASRLCGIAKPGQVIISDDVYIIIEKFVEVDPLPAVEIKGKTGQYNIYSVKTRKMLR